MAEGERREREDMTMMVAAIVQARMTSSRLPGKVMLPLMGRPVLEHVLTRAKMIPGVDKVVCAMPEDEASAPMLPVCRKTRVVAFAGDEDDVLDRYYEAAKSVEADWIMRITADCPLVDPMICGTVLRMALEEGLDYASNVYPARSYPKGFDCEVFSFQCLEATALCASNAYDKEHVTPWMQRAEIRRGLLKSKADWSDVNLCIDEAGDVERVEKLIKESFCARI